MIKDIIVITGGMGTGKSTVLELFEKNGFKIVNSDKEVLSLFNNQYEKYQAIAQDFDNWLGTDFSSKNEIDKKILRTYLENTHNGFPRSLEIVKPYISEKLSQLATKHIGEKIVFEIPLLFEAKMENEYQHIIVVTAPMDIRLKRIQLRQNHLSIKQIEQTINSQLPEEYKTSRAQFILNNSGSIEELENKFNLMLPEFLKIYKKQSFKVKL